MAAPRLRTVLRDYRPPSAACQVLPAAPVPLDDDGAAAAVTPPPHDEELFVTPDHRQVVWRPLGGPTVYKQWRFPAPVLQALWAHFDLTGSSGGQPAKGATAAAYERCLCVLRDPELLCIYPPDGQVYEVALPCHAQRLWALGTRGGGGLLIQRQPAGWEEQQAALLTAAALSRHDQEQEEEEEEESMDVMGGGSQLLLIRPQQMQQRPLGSRRARGRSHGSERSLEEQEPGHWAAGDEHDEGSTTLTLLHHPLSHRGGQGQGLDGGEGEEEAIPSIFSLRHPLDELKPVAVLSAPPQAPPATDATAAMDDTPAAAAATAGLTSPLPITVAGGAAVPSAAASAAVLLCDPRERVVHTEEITIPSTTPTPTSSSTTAAVLVVTHDGERHRLWLAQPITSPSGDEEFDVDEEGEEEEEDGGGLMVLQEEGDGEMDRSTDPVVAVVQQQRQQQQQQRDREAKRRRRSSAASARASLGGGGRRSSGAGLLSPVLSGGLHDDSSMMLVSGGGGGGGPQHHSRDELLASVLGVSTAADPDAPANANNTLLPTHQRQPKGQQGDACVYYQEHEHPIRPELLFRPFLPHDASITAATALPPSAPARRVLLLTDWADKEDQEAGPSFLLAFQLPPAGEGAALSSLQILRIRLGQIHDPSLLSYETLGGPTPCLSAVSVQTTGAKGPRDLLMLDPEHRLSLHRGASGPRIPLTPPPTLLPLGIYDAVGDRITLLCSSNNNDSNKTTRLLRCRLALGLEDDDGSPLAAHALRCLDAALPPSVALPLRADVVGVLECLAGAVGDEENEKDGGKGGGLVMGLTDVQRAELALRPGWSALLVALHQLLRSSFPSQATTKAAAAAAAPSSSLYSQMLLTAFHKEYAGREGAGGILGCLENDSGVGGDVSTTTATATPITIPGSLATDSEALRACLPRLREAWHLLFQELTLDTLRWPDLPPLGALLLALAKAVGDEAGADFYGRYLGDISSNPSSSSAFFPPLPPLITPSTPSFSVGDRPTVDAWMARCFALLGGGDEGMGEIGEFVEGGHPLGTDVGRALTTSTTTGSGGDNDPLKRLRQVVRFLRCCFFDASSSGESAAAALRVVDAMVEEGVRGEDLRTLPAGVALPLHEAIRQARRRAPEGWTVPAYALTGRRDLAALHSPSHSSQSTTTTPAALTAAAAATATAAQQGTTQAAAAASKAVNEWEEKERLDLDGLRMVEEGTRLRFGRDWRVKEACRLLRLSRPLFLKVDRPAEASDHEHLQRQQAKLLLLCRRALATPVARGMLTLGSLPPGPLLAEPLAIPSICLAGRVPPTNATVNLDTSAYTPDLTLWPEFHNGVAAGLRLAPPVDGGIVPRTWIIYNRPRSPSHAHGGLLMALGLQGHLRSLAVTDLYDYLTQGHDPTTVGIFLGMAAAKRGSADGTVSKMLCLHLPSLLSFAEVEVSPVAQTAAVLGVGLLYQGTAHRLMTEFLLGEIGKRPTSDRIQDREAYTLAAGLALGFVTLGKGGDGGALGLADLRIEERLHRYMVGGKVTAAAAPHRNRDDGGFSKGGYGPGPYPWSDGGGGSGLGSGAERGGDSKGNGEYRCGHGFDSTKCSRVHEGDHINTDVTAPGATLALGLMFIRSHKADVAARLALPDTHFLLDYVRPDLLLLRVVARALVMWDTVEPSRAWVESQIPPFIASAFATLGAGGAAAAAAAAAAGLRAEEIDWQSIRQAHAFISAGACLSLGLRFASTGDTRAAEAITGVIRHFRRLRDSYPGGGVASTSAAALAQRPERPILEMCLATAAVALGLVMAGSGDLGAFRLLRELRWRVDSEVTYGDHMALHMAIGFLFLGGGRAALSRSNEAVAALVAATFPRLPAHTSDNQYALQAMRHLYVLAVEHRGVEAVDVDSKESVYMPLEVLMRDGERRALLAPCLLPELSEVASVSTASPRYYPLTFHLSSPTAEPAATSSSNSHHTAADTTPRLFEGARRRILVQRKPGHLSYNQDPQALRSLLVRPFAATAEGTGINDQGAASSSWEAILSAFTEDPHLLAFARHFCGTEDGDGDGEQQHGNEEAQQQHPPSIPRGLPGGACAGALYECLTRGKPELLGLHLYLLQVLHALPHMAPAAAACTARSLRLVLAYHDRPARAFRRRLAQAHAGAGAQELAGWRVLFGGGGREEEGGEGGGPEADDWLVQEDLIHSLRVQADALFAAASKAAPSSLPGPFLLFYDAPLATAAGRGGGWRKRDLPLLRRRMPHVPLASLLRLLAEDA